jgi:putative oxidoreductase
MASTLKWTRERDVGLLFLRIAVGLPMSLIHGREKLANAEGLLLAGHPWGFVGLVRSLGFPMPVFFAVCAALGESVCALSVSCGLFTRTTSAVVTMTMVVAIYSVKVGTSVESAYLYAISFAALTLTGPGRFSLYQLIGRSRLFRKLPT